MAICVLDAVMRLASRRCPFVVVEFESEMAALQHAMNLQTNRGTTTDAALYRMCDEYEKLMERGGDRRSEGAESKGTRVPFDSGQCKSSQMTGVPGFEEFLTRKDLYREILTDTGGDLKSLVEQFVSASDPSSREALMEEIMFMWSEGERIHYEE